jgi:hypothetical protein
MKTDMTRQVFVILSHIKFTKQGIFHSQVFHAYRRMDGLAGRFYYALGRDANTLKNKNIDLFVISSAKGIIQ